MAKQPFRLQTVLRLRITERDAKLAELAKAHRAEEVLRERQAEFERDMAATKEATRELSVPGRADVDGLLRLHRYELSLRIQLQQLAGQLVQVQAESERRRLAVVEADRQVRVLEKLRERHLAGQRLAEERELGKELDEVAALGYFQLQEDAR